MLETRRNKTTLQAALSFFEVLYHSIVRSVRVSNGNAALGILMSLLQILALLAIFLLIFKFLGRLGGGIRGDEVLYVLTGVFLFLLHNSIVQRTISAGNPIAPLIQHAPMTTMLNILAATMADVYIKIVALGIVLLFIVVVRDVEVYRPAGLLMPFFLAWLSGITVGLFFLSIKPFAPRLTSILSMIYRRLNLISSGKFFVANSISGGLLSFFTWNPLFHEIDQARGAAFVNYNPRYTSLDYPINFVLITGVLGLMLHFWLRQNLSQSTTARK